MASHWFAVSAVTGNDGAERVSCEKLTLPELVAMGVGGMVGGGIFSVLGLAMLLSGHAAPLAFLFGGIIAMLTGYAYAHLGVRYRSDGGSFTYLEYAFDNKNIGAIGGWLLLLGYVGTLSLYAYTFGAYGAAMLGYPAHSWMHAFLSTAVLLVFLGINLLGVKASGRTELVIVATKVAILLFFAIAGLLYFDPSKLQPLFNKGLLGTLLGATVIFVAYEGFELIPNAVNEMHNPERNLPRALYYSITITAFIYVLVSLVAADTLTPAQIVRYKEYALAVAAQPVLGKLGFLLIGLGALLSTASAINATLFGTARLGMVMATEGSLPKVFSFHRRDKPIPYVSLITIALVTIAFVNVANLSIISSFSSSTFLLIFALINLAALRLHRVIRSRWWIHLVGFLGAFFSWLALLWYLYQNHSATLASIFIIYAAVVIFEFLFSKRAVLRRKMGLRA